MLRKLNKSFYRGKYNMSGKNLLASITKAAVNDNQAVNKTGAVDKYFKKLLSMKFIFL
jgi:hypothetical protein